MRSLNPFIILANLWIFCKSEDELIAVTVLVRHGSKIPQSFYPTDPYKNFSWPFILGDLTNKGVEEMYNVGKWLRKRYTPFLSQEYKANEIYAQSLDYDRCSMSGEATLAGLYPPIANDIWNKHIRWQPVPLHISPTWQDIIVNMNICPKLSEESALIRGTKEYMDIMQKYNAFFNYISQNCGQLTTMATIYPLFDTLYGEKKLGLPLPDWAEKVYPELLPIVVKYTKMDSMTPTERDIQMGPLLGRILAQFDNAIKGENFGTTETPYRKFMLYSNTEWILYDLAYTLNLPSIGIPEFGAHYLVELKKKPQGTYYVNIWYRNAAALGTKAVPAPIKGLDFNLDYNIFKDYVQPYLMVNSTEWGILCQDFTNKAVKVDTTVPMS